MNFVAQIQDEGVRIDVFVAQTLNLSRSNIQNLIEEGHVKVNLLNVPKRYTIKAGDIITCSLPAPQIYEAEPEPIPLDIVYEDKDVIVINKPKGMVVHPAPGNYSGTLVNALLYYSKDLSGINGVLRPGIVHRLDKDTSGLMIVAKNDRAHHSLATQLADRTMGRIYVAISHGIIKQDKITVETNIGRHPSDRKKMAVLPIGKGREAITHIKTLKRYENLTLAEAKLETGRTHQIRVHLAYIKHPILGDAVYGPKNTKNIFGGGQMLHAKALQFVHPSTGDEMYFESLMPDCFSEMLD